MAKERIPLDKLRVHPPYRVFRKAKDGVVGLDTEGLVTGYAFLITDYPMGNYAWLRSAEDVIAFLTNPQYPGQFCTFWNLDYDATVLVKWLGKEFCGRLVKDGKATYGGVNFEYIPKRFLGVRKGKQWSTFYDASQYYMPRSLDAASKQYLGEAKIILTTKEFHEADYEREDVLAYCKDDSRKCALLTQQLLCDLHDLGFSPSTLSSPGTIMEEALVGTVHLPDMTKVPPGALEYAYNAYRGGWVECFRKGHFAKLYDYDITSAYPYQVSELVSLTDGKWDFCKGDVPGSRDLGFVHCRVDIHGKVSPIMYQGFDVNYTPTGQWYTFLTQEEVEFVRASGIGQVEVLDGWYFETALKSVRPFKYIMRHLFRQKQVSVNSWLPKALGVSLYGKYAERDESGRTGNLFNPVYASTITARTRLQIAKYALMQPDTLCLVSTDGLTFDRPLPSRVLSDKFGGLTLRCSNEGVVLGTNMYTIKGKVTTGDWRPGRYDWLHLLGKYPAQDKYDLKFFRYTTLAEGVETDFERIGVFGDFPYTLNINYDHKRCFKHVACGGDLLEGGYDSVPWEVGIAKRRSELLEERARV